MKKLEAPLAFDSLIAIGCVDMVPCPRPRPYVRSAVLLDPRSRVVYFPPFDTDDDIEEFDWFVDDERVTRLNGAPVPAQSDGCIYFPEGSLPPEYVSLTVAVGRLREFADRNGTEGDQFMRAGQPEQALAVYELAAAFGRPEDFARMLLTNLLPPRRRDRIWKFLCQVSDSPEQEVELARARIGIIVPRSSDVHDAPSTSQGPRRREG